MYATNVAGTANVVNLCLEAGIKRLIHISSVASLGRTSNGEIISEKKQWVESKINTHYAISKYRSEMEVWRGFAEGLEGVILNPSTIVGFGNWNNSSCAIFKNAFEEFPWYTNGLNGFVYVEDVARVIIHLMNSKITGERFIISAENWTFKQLLSAMADGFHKKHPSREASPAIGQFAWRLEKIKSVFTGKKPLLSRESAKVAQSRTSFDNRKILSVLPGFQFTPLDAAILASCKQYLAQLPQ
jgi:nucleoside-diphosphate-sugar epimerase